MTERLLGRPIELLTGLEPLQLRRLTAADGDEFARHVRGDLEHLGEFLPWPAVTADPAAAAEWIDRHERGLDGRVLVAGAIDEHGGLLAGGTLFQHQPTQGTIELGVWATAPAEGGGVASAICTVLLAMACADLGVERVSWQSATGNARSRRLAEKLGFVWEGTLRSCAVLRDERLDLDVLSLVGNELDRYR